MSGSLLVVVGAVVVGLLLVGAAVVAPLWRWLRWVVGVLGVVVVATPVLVIALFLGGQPEPLEPDETLVLGARVDDDVVQVWLGPGCEAVTELVVWLDRDKSQFDITLEPTAPDPGVDATTFAIAPDGLPDGMTVEEWPGEELEELEEFAALTVTEERTAGVELEPVLTESAERPDQWWFGQDAGWLSLRDAQSRVDEGELSTACMPAPEGTTSG